MTSSFVLAIVLDGVAVISACSAPAEPRMTSDRTSARDVRIDHASTHWSSSGFAEMVPTVPSTSQDAKMRVTVWLRVPRGASMSARWIEPQHRFVVRYPAGTEADRVAFLLRGDTWRVEDDRGTSFSSDGEIFHVLRRDPRHADALVGIEWNRDDRAGEVLATRGVGELACRERNVDVGFVKSRNACPDCHIHDKPESPVVAGSDVPLGATDDGGLYRILAVLNDEVDLTDAFRRGDPHARDVCASRAYIFEHGDRTLRSAFARIFRECGLGSAGSVAVTM